MGAGPAGLAAAISLARRGYRVVLAERDGFDQRRIGEHVPPEAKPILCQLGYGLDCAEHLASPGVLALWSAGGPVERDYIFSPFGAGCNLTRPAFDIGLADVARQVGVHLIVSAKVALRSGPGDWQFDVESPEKVYRVRSKIAVDASGRRAWLARKLGVDRILSSHQVAGIAYVQRHREDSDTRLVVERDQADWWYSLPLRDQTRAVALVSSARLWAGSRQTRARLLAKRLRATRVMRALVDPAAPLRVTNCSAGIQAMARACGETWLAIGDAAVCFDPLAGRGIVKALEDGLRLPSILGSNDKFSLQSPAAYQSEIDKTLREHLRQSRGFHSADPPSRQ